MKKSVHNIQNSENNQTFLNCEKQDSQRAHIVEITSIQRHIETTLIQYNNETTSIHHENMPI